MERRDLFWILPAMAVSAAPARFLNEAELRTLDAVCQMLLPGSRGIAATLDTILHYADTRVQANWKAGLAAFDAAAGVAGGFPACESAQKAGLMDRFAAREDAPESVEERFFVVLKRAAVDAWCASAEGRRFLGYRGDGAIREFTGCRHDGQHQT